MSPEKKAPARKAAAKRAGVNPATAKKGSTRKTTAQKATAQKATAAKATAAKATAAKATAAKATAAKATSRTVAKTTGPETTGQSTTKKSTGRKVTAQKVERKAASAARSRFFARAQQRARRLLRDPDELIQLVQERAEFVVAQLGGVRAAARVLGVAPSQPTRWVRGDAVPGPEAARAIADLDHVFAVALQVWEPEVARDWMLTSNAHLDGARPLDVVRMRGSGEVVAALRAEAAGAYA